MRQIFRLLKRISWLVLVGLMLAFHNSYNQEFKSLDDVRQEICEDEEE